jgi:hypothetical protein
MFFDENDFELITADKVTIRNEMKKQQKSLIQWLAI